MSQISLPDQILLAVLAATDAVFLPDRDPLAHPRHAVIHERRQALVHGGVPWASERVLPGLDDAARKQVQRSLDELALNGLVLTYQPKGAKTLGVRLSDAGDARARALVGLPTLRDALGLLAQLAELERHDTTCAFLGRTWVPETALAGVRWGDHAHRHRFVEVEDCLLPAQVRGLAESNCSVRGHCWYAITPAGCERLSQQPDVVTTEGVASCEPARREYCHRVRQELLTLAAAKPECEREIGEIPMPVSAKSPRQESSP
jgi:hypothetical protein